MCVCLQHDVVNDFLVFGRVRVPQFCPQFCTIIPQRTMRSNIVAHPTRSYFYIRVVLLCLLFYCRFAYKFSTLGSYFSPRRGGAHSIFIFIRLKKQTLWFLGSIFSLFSFFYFKAKYFVHFFSFTKNRIEFQNFFL